MNIKTIILKFFPVVLLIFGFIISTAIWYSEESLYSFLFLRNEPVLYFVCSILTCLLPIGIYCLASERKRLRKYAVPVSFAGFIPALVLLFVIL